VATLARGIIRIYEKKRGNRRTGSTVFGSVGEAVFFAVVLLVGVGGLVALFATQVIPQWKASHEFVPHRCRVVDKRVGETETEDGTVWRPEIQIQYEVEGETYRVWTYDIWHFDPRGGYTADRRHVETVLSGFDLSDSDTGPTYACWYDPARPSVAVLTRASSWWIWGTFLVPVAFVLIGAGGLVYTISTWGKSAERRAAKGHKANNGSVKQPNGKLRIEYPHVPSGANITDSPGTKLAFRLPTTSGRTWGMAVMLATCVLWNGIVAVFVVVAVNGFLRGRPDWLLTIFVVPFLAVGIGLIVYFIRQFVLTTGPGLTLLEISDQPLHPGGHYRLFLSQTGRLRVQSLEMELVCEEEARYQHGTNTRTETRCVYRQPVLQHRRFEVRPVAPFEAECELDVPAEAMHSFKADHNEVRWKLVVKGRAEGWPDYERSFPVIVHPHGNGN
jgi:hypothetical protein